MRWTGGGVAASEREFRLPDVGEGLTEAEIVAWRVAPGDTVAVNDVLVEVETAKAAVELPSPFAGTVEALLVEPGNPVPVGTPIIAIATAGAGDAAAGPADAAATGGALIGEEGPDGRIATLVGYGPRPGAARRRPRHGGPATSPAPAAAAAATTAAPAAAPTSVPLAKPPVRKLARDLGIDLHAVAGTGAGGVITRDDVRAASAAPNVTFAGQNVPTRAGGAGCAASRFAASAAPPPPRWWPARSPRRTSRSSSPWMSRRPWRCATGCGPLASTPTSR